ncbi:MULTISPECIES: hypothetical protein [Burkholderia cepacia complex]|uniref:Uncharacterized protein n=2 Tax=Burkholderia cepacia complex TaxID=87882 RepID=A0AAP2MRX7_9BURK|nr:MULTISPECIES: hypothetical protein [Burkholderia cepacia complex]MBU9360269.1 hypothetical protein [Burkholderia multivorans]TCT26534.1 hypothetical protein EC918_12317 [Burkholderia vietnamiensis]MBR8428400.1 hypothetical protein [Burkholderia cenocepacia]MDR8730527.1 hypothetical protein [Burkholderia pseudomultivorans]MDR8738444.1 hypothetical protein [Burkholderia pseudomultivorans]
MNERLLTLPYSPLQHMTLLLLAASVTRTGTHWTVLNNKDNKVSCETLRGGDRGSSPAVPPVVARVLGDPRVTQQIDDLIATGAIRLLLDADLLVRRCELIERQWRDESLLTGFVQARASLPMIRRFFRSATRAKVTQLRQQFVVAAPVKPRVLVGTDLDALMDAWRSRSKIQDVRERYLAIHDYYDGRYTLATIFSALDTGPEQRASDCLSSTTSKEPCDV